MDKNGITKSNTPLEKDDQSKQIYVGEFTLGGIMYILETYPMSDIITFSEPQDGETIYQVSTSSMSIEYLELLGYKKQHAIAADNSHGWFNVNFKKQIAFSKQENGDIHVYGKDTVANTIQISQQELTTTLD